MRRKPYWRYAFHLFQRTRYAVAEPAQTATFTPRLWSQAGQHIKAQAFAPNLSRRSTSLAAADAIRAKLEEENAAERQVVSIDFAGATIELRSQKAIQRAAGATTHGHKQLFAAERQMLPLVQ